MLFFFEVYFEGGALKMLSDQLKIPVMELIFSTNLQAEGL